MQKLYRKQGPDIYIHFKPLVLLLTAVALILLVLIYANGVITNQKQERLTMENLTQRQAVGLVLLDEEAELPGTKEARAVVDEYERKQEIKQQKWLAAQKKRVAAAKAAAKKKAEKKAREEERKKILQIAKANTRRTYSGTYSGAVLSRGAGTVMGPSGKETYYNLDMSTCVRIMRGMGFSASQYPYKVRSDGVKTLGGYVMCAANLSLRPKGSYIMTSLGVGIVVDTGGFASRNPTQLDICVNW